MYQVICVGAIYLDTILTVPHYPDEDKKLRATNLFVRRGGNCGNTLEVLEQLVNRRGSLERLTEKATENIDSPLHLIAVLPAKDSEAVATVQASFKYLKLDPACIYRPDSTTAASSYIIRSQENGSRTIVSYTALEEMTVREFEEQAALVLSHTGAERGWFHFEGRIPETTLACIRHLRKDPRYRDYKISIELEKPEREGLKDAVKEADVVFYSKIWAEHHGCTSARGFLETQLAVTRPGALLSCTWGSGGATLALKRENEATEWAQVEAWKPETKKPVVDAIGAGDTFIAGMLYGLTQHADDWKLKEKLGFANELAGRKVYLNGFGDVVSNYFDERPVSL